jgi:hypothetical protein
MATFQEADLAQKLLLVAQFKNRAMAFAEMADDCAADLSLITARGWGTMTDAELADLGITAARLNAYVAFITQFNRLMNNQAVTTTNGRAAVDGIRNL